ncbi:MAG: cysteine--tRNA ligase [Chthoniobacterales bacterium]|nr:cysteine--tRNA ligase [Chthoniobacterales bacterium]
MPMATVQILNTLSRSLEEITPRAGEGKTLSLYTCGPTVYAYAHIGNFRAYVFEDLLQRHLQERGFVVRRVMNLTDVDDKTIRGAHAAEIALNDYTRPFKEAFFADAKTLRLHPAEAYPEATDPAHIARMIAMIGTLMEKGHAYQVEDGSVYFRIASFPNYGRLAHVDLENQRPGQRVASDEYDKEAVADFALWKAWVPEDGSVGWESPWGKGRPGWHIECSAMATGLLGETIDIHCGGVDNIFPHHEAEIAQCECAGHGQGPFVRYWMHCAHLMVEGSKMAKSAGNFFTLRDLLEKGWTGREVRYALISVHYRGALNFTMDGLGAARTALGRLDAWRERLIEAADSVQEAELPDPATEEFFVALDDDLNISSALAVLFETLRESNRRMDQVNEEKLTPSQARGLLNWLIRVDGVLALEPDAVLIIPSEVEELVAARASARDAKEWQKSDEIRDQIAALGWTVKDTKDGQRISKN